MLLCYVRPGFNILFIYFLISKKNILKEPQENIRPTKEYREGHKQRENNKTDGANKNYLQRRELRNIGIESLEVSPQALDQSKREPLK